MVLKSAQLPHTIVLHLTPDADDEIDVSGRLLFEESTVDLDLGRIGVEYKDGECVFSSWYGTYGASCQNDGETDLFAGPVHAIGGLVDNALELLEDDDSDEDDSDEDDSDEDDSDEDDSDEDDNPPSEPGDDVHLEGRRWCVVSRTDDSLTQAMAVRGKGVLVRVESFGDQGGEYGLSTTFIPGVTLIDLLTETM